MGGVGPSLDLEERAAGTVDHGEIRDPLQICGIVLDDDAAGYLLTESVDDVLLLESAFPFCHGAPFRGKRKREEEITVPQTLRCQMSGLGSVGNGDLFLSIIGHVSVANCHMVCVKIQHFFKLVAQSAILRFSFIFQPTLPERHYFDTDHVRLTFLTFGFIKPFIKESKEFYPFKKYQFS